MTILIGQHEFDGPVSNFADIPAVPGLYALLYKDTTSFMLVEINQTDNLAKTLAKAIANPNEKILALLRCHDLERRKAILNELIHNFEFDDEEPRHGMPTKGSETKSGIALSIS